MSTLAHSIAAADGYKDFAHKASQHVRRRGCIMLKQECANSTHMLSCMCAHTLAKLSRQKQAHSDTAC